MTTKPFQASSGTGIALPGPQGRYGRGGTAQQRQDVPADPKSPDKQQGAAEAPKQAS